jgi:uncharacterized RDD family membrane protein YckC
MTAAPLAERLDELSDTTVRLVTPERIGFDFPLAGPFRRSLAYLLDLVLIMLLAIAGAITATAFALGSSSGMGLFLVFGFALMWGYGAFWEAVFNGQTPGKRALGIRVVTDQGVPITGAQAFLRNIIWPFDGILLAYIPAIVCMFLTPRFQRLGDLAAGTMVMVEHSPRQGRLPRLDEPAVRDLLAYLPIGVAAGPELARALADYVKHRPRFPRARREEMAAHVARPLRLLYNLPGDTPGDVVLCAMYHRVFHGD